jgi:Pentapeptide repeats (8 copies)
MSRVPVQARWVGAVVLAVAFLLWLVLFAPRLLVPAASRTDLQQVPAAAKWQARDSRIKLQNDVRTTLLQGVGGLAVLLGAFYAYQQMQTGRGQLQVAQQGQVTERFTRAIEQLGHENLDVRLGGIYALERIARDSPADRATIGEVLTAYIRSHAPWPPTRPGQYVATAPIEEVPDLKVRAPDVQACLTVLCRGGFAPDQPQEHEDLLDLSRVDLRRVNLLNVDLRRTILSGANLAGASLLGVDLWRAHLERANLARADIIGGSLKGAQLFDANLERTLFRDTILRAYFDGADLSGADLRRADLGGARLRNVVADASTRWPEGFDWKAAGVRLREE